MATRKKKPAQHTIVIQGRPVPKGRPRLGRRGRVFTPEKTLIAEASIRDAWDGPLFEGSVAIRVLFNDTTTEVTVIEYDGTKSKLRGDLDNYVKTLMDGLNGVAWTDDKQVHYVEATKE
jgi:crossover junction endodeoxyribonuclease RusA